MPGFIKDILRRLHILWLSSHRAHEFTLKGRVLIVAPHPDDEVIGCGGLIARLVEQGRAPQVVVLTGGEGSHHGCCGLSAEEIKTARRELTRNALQILGVPEENIHGLNFPDGGISGDCPEVGKLSSIINEIAPETILVPHWGEGWPDHINAAKIVKELAPKQAAIYEYCVWMWYYNVWRGLDWKNAYKLVLSPREHELKLAAMDAYIKPLAPCGKPWSGVLPDLFISANQGPTELSFKVR